MKIGIKNYWNVTVLKLPHFSVLSRFSALFLVYVGVRVYLLSYILFLLLLAFSSVTLLDSLLICVPLFL